MAFKIKTQVDHFLTDVVVEMPADVKDVHEQLRGMKTSGDMKILYNQGGVIGISFTQKTKLTEAQSNHFRSELGIETKII
jgi:hypothetical protein